MMDDEEIPPEVAVQLLKELSGEARPPPRRQEVESLLKVITSREDVPPVVQRLLFGFLSPTNAFSNLGDRETKIERLHMNATLSMIETFMPKNRLTPEFMLLMRNIKSAHNHILSKAKRGALLRELHTQYHEQSFAQKQEEEKGGWMKRLGFG